MRNKWVQLGALTGVPILMVLGNAMLIPILPEMGRSMNLSKATTGLTITAFSLAAGLGIAFAGYASDRWGRKKVIIPAVLIYGFGGVIAGLAGAFLGKGAFPIVMVGRVVQGLGAAGTAPVAMAFVGDLFEDGGRVSALGILEAANGFGKLISPFVGALLGLYFTWWIPFLVFAAFSIPVAALVLFLTKEEKPPDAPPLRKYLKSVKDLLRKEGAPLLGALWIGTVALTVLFAMLFYFSEHLEEDKGIEGLAKACWLAGPVGAMTITAFLTGLVLNKKPKIRRKLVGIGLGLTFIGLLLMAFLRADWAQVLGLVLLGIGTGMQLPGLNDQITSSAPASQRGMISALYGAVRFFGVAFGPPLVGILMLRSQRLPFVAAAILVVTAFLALLPKPKSDSNPKEIPPWRPPTEALSKPKA